MVEIVFLLEEPSAEAMLQGLLPRILPADLPVRFVVFEGKQDLEKQLVRRLRGYRKPRARFVVLRDKDSADCHVVKTGLVEKCRDAGRPDALVRIACHEIESWFLSDLAAVEQALQINQLSAKQDRAKFRSSDALANASQELEKLTNYRYQKIAGSRAIGPYLDPDNTRSHSFAVFVSGLRRLAATV